MKKFLIAVLVFLIVCIGVVAINAENNPKLAPKPTPTPVVVKPTPAPAPTPTPTPQPTPATVTPQTVADPNFVGK